MEGEIQKNITECKKEASNELSKVQKNFASLETNLEEIKKEAQVIDQHVSSKIIQTRNEIDFSLKQIGNLQ